MVKPATFCPEYSWQHHDWARRYAADSNQRAFPLLDTRLRKMGNGEEREVKWMNGIKSRFRIRQTPTYKFFPPLTTLWPRSKTQRWELSCIRRRSFWKKPYGEWRHPLSGGRVDNNGFCTNIDASRDTSAVRSLVTPVCVSVCSPSSTHRTEINPFTAAACRTYNVESQTGADWSKLKSLYRLFYADANVNSCAYTYIGWQWRNFFISAVLRHFVGQALRNVCCSDVSRRHFLNKYGHFLKPTDSILFE